MAYTTAAAVKVLLGRPFDEWIDADVTAHITQAEAEIDFLLAAAGVQLPVVSPSARLVQVATVWSANHILRAQGHMAAADSRVEELGAQVKEMRTTILHNPGSLGVPLVDTTPQTYADDPASPSVSNIGLP